MTKIIDGVPQDREQAIAEFATNNTFLSEGSMAYELTLKVEDEHGGAPTVFECPLISAYIVRWHLELNDYLVDACDPDPNAPDCGDDEDFEDDGSDMDDEDFDDYDMDEKINPAVVEITFPVTRDIVREVRLLSQYNYGEVTLRVSYVQKELGRPLLRHVIKGYVKSPTTYSGIKDSPDALLYTMRIYCHELELNIL